MPEIALNGCTPEPLMNYLKALGVLRLVSEQKDKNAKGCWRNGVFWLKSELDESGLVQFFLEQYRPTPLVAPWGARSGFFGGSAEKTARNALTIIEHSRESRLHDFQIVIKNVRTILKRFGFSSKPKNEEKLRLMQCCRANMPDNLLDWIDTAFVLTTDGRTFPPLLGTGGNEGSGSYVSGFAQQVVTCIESRHYDSALTVTLFSGSIPSAFIEQTPGHFSTVASGGANHGQGFEARTFTNPWDYLLCLEGTCLWASIFVRKCDLGNYGVASFPFTTKLSPIGYSGLESKDRERPTDAKRDIAEVWLPIWSNFTSIREIRNLIGEGRASIKRRRAITGLDFALAATGLGTDRGLKAFYRTCFLVRNGKSFMSIPLGRFDIRARQEVDLIREIDRWLGRFRIAASDGKNRKAPPRFKSALRRIESAIFDFCQFGSTTRFGEILCALGQAERELAVMDGKVGQDNKVEPLSGLSPEWLKAANDGSIEFELALALATIWDPERKIGPLRSNLETVTWFKHLDWKGYTTWAARQKSVVWTSADLIANLVEVLERRMLDGSRSNCENVPLAGRHKASLNAISAFIAGGMEPLNKVDDARIEELLWGMVLIDHTKPCQKLQYNGSEAPPTPRAYALLKLLFLSDEIETKTGKVRIKPEARVLSLLRAGRADEACTIAARRLRISKVIPMPHGRITPRDGDWGEATECIDPRRLAAALLFPINKDSVEYLKRQVIRPEKDYEGATWRQ